MTSFDNHYKLHRLLSKARVPIPLQKVMEVIECSKSTVMRLVAEMREKYHAPIEHQDDYPPGYRYTDKAYELPGIWFSIAEMQALLLLLTILQAFNPGLLEAALAPLGNKLAGFLRKMGVTTDIRARIRVLRARGRPIGAAFEKIAVALFQRKRLDIGYYSRATDKTSEREISPQRITYYDDNWYLDAYCHKQNAVRTFSIDCIEPASVLDTQAVEISPRKLDRELGASYGIFSGPPVAVAHIRVTPERARWVAPEVWHPKEESWTEASGHLNRKVPYSRPDELILDILRLGPDVEVIAPLDLRQAVAERLRAAAAQYS